ncbi:MAG: hypothetical protein AAF539_06330 [Planctomycetota bacterium]
MSYRLSLICLLAIGIGVSSTSNAPAQDGEPRKAVPTKAVPVAKATPTKAKPIKSASPTPQVRPLSVTVDLAGDLPTIEGTLTDTTQLQMQTSFGTASIPLSEVAGIKFASADDATTTVVMLNGDSITGATDIKIITVETEWGTASVNGPNISSLMFVPGLKWNPQDGLNGKRWSLTDVPAAKPATATTQSASSSPNNSRIIQQGLPSPARPLPAGTFRSGQFFQSR